MEIVIECFIIVKDSFRFMEVLYLLLDLKYIDNGYK